MLQPSAGCSFALLQRQADCPECSVNVCVLAGSLGEGKGPGEKAPCLLLG